MRFLEKIADKFLTAYGQHLHQLAFVFPTRRAGLYFLHQLRRQKGENTALWAPRVFSGSDFLVKLSGLTIPDPLELIFTLYDIYHRGIKDFPREFEDFYSWGKMILSDFDEIDKHMIDADELFRTLKEFKAVEANDMPDRAAIYRKYTGFWEDLGVLYREFNRVLEEKQRAYEGMAFRRVAAALTAGSAALPSTFTWEKVIFCGFNALTRSEETIIKTLLGEQKAEIYWDMDRYFVDNIDQEAGYFFRRSRDFFGSEHSQWVEDRLAEARTIDIMGVQSKVSQAKVLGLKLEELLKTGVNPEDIAVVLPDETMLFPVLNSLPKAAVPVNITIGYPLDQTPVFSLFHAIIEMQSRAGEIPGSHEQGQAKGEPGFYYKDLYRVLNHPYIKAQAADKIKCIVNAANKQNLVYLDLAKCLQILQRAQESADAGDKEAAGDGTLPPAITGLFRRFGKASGMIDFFLELLGLVRQFFQSAGSPQAGQEEQDAAPLPGTKEKDEEGNRDRPGLFGLLSIDYEYIYHFYTLLTRLRDSLKTTGTELDSATFRRLFTDIVKNSRIPFTGEPLEGLQIMGVLETQALHFDHIFLLSLNEGYLPPGRNQHSFIPFEYRLAKGLPTYKEHDTTAAYHFYRLLKNSQDINLLYTTEARGMEKTEKSRFIDQILIEFAVANPRAKISHEVIDFAFTTQQIKPVIIPKSGPVMAALAKRSYSASSLLDYLACPLKFYFSHILHLKEEDEVFESPDQRLTGDIIHETLKELYGDACRTGKTLSYPDLDKIKKDAPDKLAAVFMKTMYQEENTASNGKLRTGRNRVIFEVMKKFLDNFFEKEKQAAGFQVKMLEKEIKDAQFSFRVEATGSPYTVQLHGYIDRVDVDKEGHYRIIDYKTGNVNSLKCDSIQDIKGSAAAERRECFQLLFYRILLAKSKQVNIGSHECLLGIYPFKKLDDQLTFVTIDKATLIDQAMVNEFEQVLSGIFQEIFDPAVPFTQAADESNCRYCPYTDICSREPAQSYG